MTDGWQALTASVRGAMHDRKGLPNQDAVATTRVGSALIAAVADGHGGDRYVRSDTGSRIAVDVACATAALALADEPGARIDRVLDALPARIVDEWTALVAQDLASRAFDDEERHRAGVSLDDEPSYAYGATLLLAIVTEEAVGVLQLGDGDVVVGTAGGSILSPVPTDDRLVAGQTTSLCLPTATRDFRAAVVPGEVRADFVLLASDGYGNSFADASWREQVTIDLRRRIAREGAAAVQNDLPRWLAESAHAAGDDTTVAVLTRAIDDATIPAAPVRATAPAVAPRGGNGNGTRPDRRRWVVPLAIVGAAIAGLLVGLVVGGGNESSQTSATSSPAATSTTLTTSSVLADAVQVVGPKGGLVIFTPSPDAPDAHVVATTGAPSATTQLRVGDETWTVTGGRVTVRTAAGRTVTVDIDGFNAASIIYAGGYIWVIDDEEGSIAAVDPAEHSLLGGGVKRISNPLAGPTQEPGG